MPSAQQNETETKLKQKPKQNTKTAVKRLSCFSQSQTVSAVYAKLLSIMLSITDVHVQLGANASQRLFLGIKVAVIS